MTEMEKVWRRIKDRAAGYGDASLVISMADARGIVREMCRDELTARTEPPPDTVEYLATELVRLTLEAGEIRSPRLRRFHRGFA